MLSLRRMLWRAVRLRLCLRLRLLQRLQLCMNLHLRQQLLPLHCLCMHGLSLQLQRMQRRLLKGTRLSCKNA